LALRASVPVCHSRAPVEQRQRPSIVSQRNSNDNAEITVDRATVNRKLHYFDFRLFVSLYIMLAVIHATATVIW